MEAVSLAIFLCAFFVFSAEGEKPQFTKETEKRVFAMEGHNVTLEWQYTVGGGQLYSQIIFASEIHIMDKYSTSRPPWIRSSYRGRLLMNITNDYTSIVLLGVKRTDEGSYRLTVVNQDRDRTDSRKVDIFVQYLDQPKIHLTDNRPVERTDVTLNCTASGKPDPTISWTVNGSPLHTSGNSGISFRNGNKELTMMNVNKTDSGEYQCVAHNILGNISSNASKLSVQYQPEVALNPLNTTKAEGENITWSCTATGDPEPKISWMFNGSRINITYSPNTFFSNDRQKMTITNVSRTERGEYQCLASNMLGNTSSQVATLDVIYIPEITAHPQNETRKEGDNATFICNAIGNPVPKISWNKGGAPLRNNSRISLSADNKHLTIANVSRVDSGAYRCVAINSLGNDTSNPAYLGVLYKPNINPLPRTIQRIEGGKVTFFCNASGNPLPRITWTIDGNSVDTSNSSRMNLFYEGKRLTVKNVSRRNSGVYRCVAENSIGNVTSNGITLRVHYKPDVTIIDGPRQFAVVGKSKKLICKYDALPPVSKAQWIKDGDVIVRNSSLLVNESRFSVLYYNESQIQLLINQSTSQDAGNYTCLIINSVGNSSQKTSVISQELPLITTRPEGKTPIEGEKITLFCNATGNPEPSISWIKDGSPIRSNSRIGISQDSKRLTITNVSRTDSGEYQCEARNGVGNDTSNSRVDVLFEPEVTIDGDQEQYVAKGSNIQLICRYEASPPVSEVQWIKEGTLIARNTSVLINDSRVTIQSFNESQIQLSITAASLKDGRNYICKVTNNLNSTQDTTMIIVKDKPEIATHPQNITTREGQNVTIYCNATGNPAPTISWYKNGYPINISFSTILSPSHEQLTIRNVNRIDSGDYICQAKNRVGTDTSNASTINVQFMHLMNVNRNDSGKYRCVASNKLGNDTSKAAKLNVKYRPEITKHPQNITVTERNNVTLTCNATGNPEPQFSWYKVENTVKRNNRINVSAENSHLTITDVNREDSGGYLCVAHNKVGNDTSIIVILDVQYKPEIATHLHNIRTREGQNVTLYCNATGNPALTISWYKNEYPISNDSRIILSPGHEQLTIRNVNRKDSGNYTCRANNSVGTDTSNASTINVQFRAEIVSHPQANVTKEEGSELTLFCNATGNPAPIILWTKDGSPINNNSRIRFSIHNRLLTISNVNRTDNGHYRCVANNSLGNGTSNVATVDIQYKPEITSHPKNVDMKEGGNVTFSCNSTANPLPTTSWTKDESPITKNLRISFSVVNKVLTITNVTRNDSGKYRCVANNKLGNDTSEAAELNVKYEPEIITDPSDDKVKEEQNTTFYCNATGNPLPAISWKKDGHSISNNSRISYSAKNNELTIINVYRTDNGKYHCVANNSIGNASSDAATLVVEYKSEITTHPSNVTETEGESVTLHCNATGYPFPTLSWTKDGSDIGKNSRISFSADKKQLVITKASREDSGAYRCVANNSLGNDTSMAAVVDVQFAPEISIHPRIVTIVRGDSVTFSCSVVGNPTPSVVWEKDREDLNVTGNSRFNLSSRDNNHSLEIAEVHRSDSGQYRCVAENSKNISYSSAATLTVQYVPDPPKDVKVITRGSREVNISWTAGFDGNSAIQNYTVEIGKDKQTFRDAICQGTLSKNNCVIYSTRVSIKDLLPWTKYYLSVFATNTIGSSNHSSVVNVTTDEEVPSSAPPFNVTVLSSTAVNVSWQMLTEEKARGAILGYYILYKRKSEPEASWKNRTVDGAENTSLVLASLDEYTSYQFAIKAFNRKGVSGRSEIVEKQTDEAVPRSAPTLHVTVLNSTAVNVSWQMLTRQDARGVIQGYYILYKRVSDLQLDWENDTINRAQTTYLVVGSLEKYTRYQFSIQAFNRKGVGVQSNVTEMRTDEDVPSEAPEGITAAAESSTSIKLEWKPVPERDLNGIFTKYFITYSDGKTRKVSSSSPKVVINGLRASTTYSFHISAATAKGEGPQSKPTEATTDDPPTPPDPDDVGTNEVSVAFKPWKILSNGDEVSYYQIIVVPLEEGKDPGKPSDKKYVNVIKRYEDKSEGEPYITAEFSNNNKQRKTFPVGDAKYYSRESHVVARRKRREVYTKYFNGKLDDDTEYAVFQRSLSENGYYQDEGFSQFTTKTLPREEETTPGKKNKHLIVVGVFIGLFIVCVVVVGGIVIVWLRGRRQNNANDDGEEISLEEQGYENFDPEGEIAVEEFEDHVKRLQEDDLFSVEYGAIRSQGNVTSKATLAEENKHKNRYNNIVAYDHSRVKLTPIEGVRGSDYINANFLDGYQKDKAYIATQGPLEHTSDDFWRMVWEQGTKTIVMVTNLEEKGRLKCHQYWPSEGAESYGDIRVTLMQTVQLTEFTIRTMTVKHANNTEQRTVNQYHYTVWPDHGVPECPSSLLTFVRKASRANPPDAGPMVVHCSAGVGRTGTFIVVDAMLRRIAAEKTVDVYEYVTSLRQDRNFMVQVEEQYILIHDVLVEAIHSGFTEIHANDLRSHIKNLMQVNQTSGQSEMDEEFIRLGRCINASQLTAQAANMACNVTKNRYPNALPYDETRVKLSVISGVEGSDYINANFIDGYMTRRAFIATQAPIPDTIPDFWRMIWEQESSTIVVLSKETEGDKVKVHQYWPAEKPAHIGTLVVEKTSEMAYEDYTMREMKLTHTKESASRVVRQYHYTGWPDSGSPESGTGLIDLIGQVQRWQQQSENTKITVHCSAGVGRTGVFCALSILIGQLKSEGVVDVFQTVKQLRVERPAMVQTKDQYEFIYSALSEYLDSFDAYSNF